MPIHENQPRLEAGAALKTADAAMILLHGRGATADDAIRLGELLSGRATNVALIAPQAAGNAWYPQRFIAPLSSNEPHLSSALNVVARIIDDCVANGFIREKLILAGFSQGACLALEFVARNPRRYGAVIALSGGLIGPPGMPRTITAALEQTPIFIGCGDADSHIPLGSVQESAAVLRKTNAAVTERIYPGMPHTVNADEVSFASELIARVAGGFDKTRT
ncbi:MAG: alpha/beta fold hydrolase [Nibricoccus sp.]